MKIDDIFKSNKSTKEKYEEAEKLFYSSCNWVDNLKTPEEKAKHGENISHVLRITSLLHNQLLIEKAEELLKEVK